MPVPYEEAATLALTTLVSARDAPGMAKEQIIRVWEVEPSMWGGAGKHTPRFCRQRAPPPLEIHSTFPFKHLYSKPVMGVETLMISELLLESFFHYLGE